MFTCRTREKPQRMKIQGKNLPFYIISKAAVHTVKNSAAVAFNFQTAAVSTPFVSQEAACAARSYAKVFLNYTHSLETRLRMLRRIDSRDPQTAVSTLNRIIKAVNGSNEYAEVVEAALKKLAKFKEEAQSAVPSMERLLDRKNYNPLIQVKRAVYDTFLSVDPSNEVFLDSMNKAAQSPFESVLFSKQINKLLESKTAESEARKDLIAQIRENYTDSSKGKLRLPSYILSRMKLSRSITNPDSKIKNQAFPNYLNAFNYVIENHKINKKPTIEDLKNINKLLCENILFHGFNARGVIRGSKEDIVPPRRPSIKFTPNKDVEKRIRQFEKWYNKNYDKTDPFEFAARVNQQITEIHPFYDGNGRSARLFTDMVLASKGYFMKGYSEKYLLAFNLPVEETAKIIKNSSVPISEMKFHK